MIIILIFHSTVPIPQQSSETCAGLDTMIVNRNESETGLCARNSLCTAVTCINLDVNVSVNSVVTFSPCDNPISVGIWAVNISAGITPIAIDQISTENQAIPFLAPLTSTTWNVMFSQTNTGVNFGVSSNLRATIPNNKCYL